MSLITSELISHAVSMRSSFLQPGFDSGVERRAQAVEIAVGQGANSRAGGWEIMVDGGNR